jgi:hypothetical protein
MTGGTEGSAQRVRTLKAEVRRGGSPVTATPIYLSTVYAVHYQWLMKEIFAMLN